MNLLLPDVGTTVGPTWAEELNSALSIIDAHDHSAGSGAPITPSGLNVNAAINMQSNDLINARSVRMVAQASPLGLPADLGCIYVSGVDLYYNDELGNQIQITDSGGVAGTPGSIAGLVSPASATYVSGTETFVWQSNATVAANMDMRSAILRDSSAGSFGVTLQVPTLASDYTLTLPQIPVSQKLMTLDNGGVISAPWSFDGSTISVISNIVQVPSGGITANQLATDSVTTIKIQDSAVITAKIANQAVTAAKIQNNSITTNQISNSAAITNTQLAPAQVSRSTATGVQAGNNFAICILSGLNGSRPVRITLATNDGSPISVSYITGPGTLQIRKNATNISTLPNSGAEIRTVDLIDATPGSTSVTYQLWCSDAASQVFGVLSLIAVEL
jgi:hypothetical protein